MDQNFTENTFDNAEPINGANAYSDTGAPQTGKSATSVKDMKEKMADQASQVKDKLTQQATTIGNQLTERIDGARGKTSAGLRKSSERIQNLAMYVEEHDARDMSDAVVRTSKEMVRKYPGRSLLAGMVVGLLVGRIFTGGGHHHHK